MYLCFGRLSVCFSFVIKCGNLQPISVVFQVGAHGCGLLDPGSETIDVSHLY